MRVLSVMALMILVANATAQDSPPDPTRPPTQAEIDAWFGSGPNRPARSELRLQSILLAPDRRIAIIDGERVRVGDRIDRAEVRVIEPGRVLLERNGESIELTIDTHLTNDNDSL